jgi:hypothetical protein
MVTIVPPGRPLGHTIFVSASVHCYTFLLFLLFSTYSEYVHILLLLNNLPLYFVPHLEMGLAPLDPRLIIDYNKAQRFILEENLFSRFQHYSVLMFIIFTKLAEISLHYSECTTEPCGAKNSRNDEKYQACIVLFPQPLE